MRAQLVDAAFKVRTGFFVHLPESKCIYSWDLREFVSQFHCCGDWWLNRSSIAFLPILQAQWLL